MALLIRSVHVLGSNRPAEERSDVLVQGDRISAVGDFPNKKEDVVIEGQGAYIAPGFIDMDTTSDHYLTLFDDQNQEDFLAQGITTIIGGECGSSLAPLLSGSLESIQKWANTNAINVNWHTMDEFLRHMDKVPLGVNFGTLMGHSTIRRALINGALRDLTMNELSTFGHILERGLKEGAFGMSVGLGSVHGQSASYKELRFLAEILNNRKAIFSSHLRKSGKEIQKGFEEIRNLHQETGVNTLITHLTPQKGAEAEYASVLKSINEMPESNFHFSIYPFPVSTVPLYTFLPKWAQSNLETMNRIVADPKNADRLLTDLDTVSAKDFVIAEAMGNEVFTGKTLQDIMQIYGLPTSKKALLKLMASTKLRAVVHYKNLNSKLIAEAIRSPKSLISSHAPSVGSRKNFFKSERSTSTFTEFLRLVQKERFITLEEAIQKITVLPAKKLGLTGRGEIKEGNFANLTIFRGNEIMCVVVNGQVAWQNGAPTGKLSGKILRNKNV